jgi:hypothetical protein
MNILPVLVTGAVLVIFPAFIFYLLVCAIRDQGTRWWGIVILLSILTCYCTTMVGVAGLIVGGNSIGSAALEQRYCEAFRVALTQTDTLPEAIARMDAAADAEEYQIKEPDKDLRFRYVWLLGGCFLFAGANLMMFAPGRRERRHPTDCVVMILAALVVFLTGIWQIAWGNGYAFQASAYRRLLTGWHERIQLDRIHASNSEVAAKLSEDGVKGLNGLWRAFLELSGEEIPGVQNKKEKTDAAAPADAGQKEEASASGTGPGVAIIGGADGPTAVFVSSELLKKQSAAPADGNVENEEENADAAGAD